ncbi:MAG: hypothetical protein J0H08_03205, partial [Rhizobiales bacterium]|nr:hypothetical protein [Hyphomicrobiales bacterium]
MAMPDDDPDPLAGEYVLGTLAPDERLAAERRLRDDPSFRRAVSAWEITLQPLADAAGEVAVTPALRQRVLSALERSAAVPPSDRIVVLERSRRRCRAAFAASTAAAAVLAVFVAVEQMRPRP